MLFGRHLYLLACLIISMVTRDSIAQQLPAGDRLIVCNKVENSVSIFAVAARRELAVLATGISPHEVAVASDGRTAVVTNYGNGSAEGSLTVIDLVEQKVRRTIEFHSARSSTAPPENAIFRPHGVCFNSEQCVLITSQAQSQLMLIDVRTGKHRGVWSTPQQSMHLVSVTRDGLLAAASSFRDDSLVFFDLTKSKKRMPTMIKTGKGCEGVAMHTATGNAWVCNRSANTISIVSAKTGKIINTLVTGDAPRRITSTADQKIMLVTCIGSGELMLFDANQQELLRETRMHGDRSEQSSRPLDVVSGPDSQFAYVTCARGEFVAIVDLINGQFIDRIDARKGPDGIAYARPSAVTTIR